MNENSSRTAYWALWRLEHIREPAQLHTILFQSGPHRTTKSLGERGCTVKHVVHVCDTGNLPLRQILVKRFGTSKHELHNVHFGHVPLGYVPIERLRQLESLLHVRNRPCVPLGQILMKLSLAVEERLKAVHFGHIPAGNESIRVCGAVSIFIWRAAKATGHGCHKVTWCFQFFFRRVCSCVVEMMMCCFPVVGR